MRTSAPRSIILIRLLVGVVFFTEGIRKFLYPAELGVGRFIKIGIPHPTMLAPFVGAVEIIAGALIIIGLLTRLASIALLIDIIVAIISTKVPIFLGSGFWKFSLPKVPRYGFWSMAHEARVDYSMLLGLLFLLIVGAGFWSFDARHSGGGSSKKAPR